MSKTALILGGGAPNFTLMTGALSVCEERGFRFDVVSGAGAGGLVALIYLAPNGMTRADMLRNSVNLGVSDVIYDIAPVNYKVFVKGGSVARQYRKLLTYLPHYKWVMNQYGKSRRAKLISDLIQAWWAITTPTTVNYFSQGICDYSPVLSNMYDLKQLRHVAEDVYLNAYCVEDRTVHVFNKTEIDEEIIFASHAFPFVFPPPEINGGHYIEGAIFDGFNIKGLLQREPEIRQILVFDIFGDKGYLQVPPNLWQALGQMIASPLIDLDRKDLRLLKTHIHKHNELNPDKTIELKVIDFQVPSEWLPTAMDWSRSNLNRMFKHGRKVMKDYWPLFP